MFTHKDIENRTIFVIHCLHDRNLKVSNGELLLEDTDENAKKKVLTKIPFQKVLALFITGPISITTPLLDKCKQFNVAIVVTKFNLRPVFYWSNCAEGNFLLRQRQYLLDKKDIFIAKRLMENKLTNQLSLLRNTRERNKIVMYAREQIEVALAKLPSITEYNTLLSAEGNAAKLFFGAYFQKFDWQGRRPRAKVDYINTTLDIGYTILFNFVECFVRMFGFDIFIGVYHRLWFRRKSLICDLMEPFRCVIEHTVRRAIEMGDIKAEDFDNYNGEYKLKYEKCGEYYRMFYDALIPHKGDVFEFVREYYRSFMCETQTRAYPKFLI